MLRDTALGGELWNVEVKRRVPRHVRAQRTFAFKKLAALRGKLPGTYAADLRIDLADAGSRVNESALALVTAPGGRRCPKWERSRRHHRANAAVVKRGDAGQMEVRLPAFPPEAS